MLVVDCVLRNNECAYGEQAHEYQKHKTLMCNSTFCRQWSVVGPCLTQSGSTLISFSSIYYYELFSSKRVSLATSFLFKFSFSFISFFLLHLSHCCIFILLYICHTTSIILKSVIISPRYLLIIIYIKLWPLNYINHFCQTNRYRYGY